MNRNLRRWQRLAMIYTVSSVLSAANVMASPHDLSEVKNGIKTQHQNLKQIQQAQTMLQKKIKSSDLAISKQRRHLHQHQRQQQQLSKKINQLEKKIDQLHAQQQKMQTQLSAFIRYSHIFNQHGNQAWIDSRQSTQHNRLQNYQGYFLKKRTARLDALQKITAEKKGHLVLLAAKKNKLIKTETALNQAQKKFKLQKKQRLKTLNALQQHLTQEQAKLQLYQSQAEEIQIILQEKKFSQKNQHLQGLSNKKGQLNWPTKGQLHAKFGQRRSGQVFWKGLMVKAAEGAPIQTIAAGKVIFSDWVKGLGLLTAIDHGNGFMSLYGHAQTLYTQVGDSVQQNETIALVGASGGLMEPSLYFEIRHKGKAVNPIPFLSR
ncbi:MAG: peptidoglycan DD-metalloendopeptidase family protein [Shewanellaceae bacterium]|nr:peptidoglycan DD-metalloendopeptidase family protein [Shewanellaceae bacterium]